MSFLFYFLLNTKKVKSAEYISTLNMTTMINQPKNELVKQSLPYQEPQDLSGPINQVPCEISTKELPFKEGDN